MAFLCKNGHLVKNSWQADMPCTRCRANDRRREKRVAAKLDGIPDQDAARENYLIDKAAEYRMMGFQDKEARENAMSDWHQYQAQNQ